MLTNLHTMYHFLSTYYYSSSINPVRLYVSLMKSNVLHNNQVLRIKYLFLNRFHQVHNALYFV